MKNLTPTEDQEAQTFATWLRFKNFKFTHIANESGLPPKVAMIASAKKKRMGLSPGVPDFMVIIPNGLIFIELKRLKGSKTSEEQKEWVSKLNKIPNVEAKICYGATQAIDFVASFL